MKNPFKLHKSKTQEIREPVFIIGAPRSGTTLLYELLANHSDFAYFTMRTKKIIDKGLPIEKLKNESVKPPIEGHEVWNKYCPCEDHYLEARDLTEEAADYFRTMIKAHLNYQQKIRFLSKTPRNSMRIGYIKALFPDTKFIIVKRDLKAIARSLLEKRIQYNDLFWGAKPKAWREFLDLPPLAASYFQAALLYADLQEQLTNVLRSDYLYIEYEKLISSPQETIIKILQFTNLREEKSLMDAIDKTEFKNQNYKLEQISALQKLILMHCEKSTHDTFFASLMA